MKDVITNPYVVILIDFITHKSNHFFFKLQNSVLKKEEREKEVCTKIFAIVFGRKVGSKVNYLFKKEDNSLIRTKQRRIARAK